ncbi:MAG: glycosyltransferase family 4 protein [Ilumatobacteraceae bacterium]
MAAGTVLMRFLILTQYFPPEVGAPQTRLSSLCRALRAHGHEVEVVTAVPNYPFGRIDERYRRTVMRTEEMDGVTVRRVLMYPAMGSGTKRLVSYASFTAMCVIGLVRSKRADHVFVESPPLFLAVPGRLVAWLWRATAIFNVADLWPDAAVDLGLLGPGLPLRVLQAIERWAYRSYDVVNSVTDSVRRVLTDGKGIPSESCSTSRTGSTRNCSDPSLLSDGPCTISPTRWCTPGRSDTSMRPSTSSVRSAARRTGPRRSARVHYATGSELDRLRAHADRLGLATVSFADPVPLPELAEILPGALAGVVTLADNDMARKTRPSKMFPTMASGRPVLYCGDGEVPTWCNERMRVSSVPTHRKRSQTRSSS